MTFNRLFFALILTVFVAIIVYVALAETQKNPYANINNFDDCARAGYPVMESYPRECTLPGGKFFVEKVMADPVPPQILNHKQ